ncbi:Acetyltransferase (GNAT) family protein [Micromonospora pallida]|uniref:Acetyltransferase (GNAT) family protein n=1 Tax=Micromonospora pallida TaxID=145854 RepID=A0A1C6THR6_9ACTN|nr:GNAT family N-acetyltransferase [Micromonospora pallida]SCL41274.1 Acetyltransferase (GNAT) family protein [Micromonospora pallida]
MTSGAAAPRIRPVRPADVPAVVAMVHELAEYERAADQCHLTVGQLDAALFGPEPALFGDVAVDETDQPLAFALWLLNFSTWAGTHGIHLEDLYVRPSARGTGVGRRLLATLAARCVERGYRRLEWMMLDWNPAAGFYRAIDASTIDDWVPYRLDGAALRRLAAEAAADEAAPGSTG